MRPRTKEFLLNNFLPFLAIFVAVLACKWSFLSLPFFYEERPFTINAATTTNIWTYITEHPSPHYFGDHPPLFPYAAALWRFFFGVSPFSVHFFMALVSSVGLFFTGKIVQKLTPSSKRLAWVAPILLFAYPDFFIHSTNYRYDIWLSAIGAAFVYFRLANSMFGFFFAGAALAFSRETSLAFMAAAVLADFHIAFWRKDKRAFHFGLAGLFCSALWSLQFIHNYLFFGRPSSSAAYDETVKSFARYVEVLQFDLNWLFLADYRFVLTVGSILALAWLAYRKKRVFRMELGYLLLPCILFSLGMAFHIYEASYYLLPCLPLLYAFYAHVLLSLRFPAVFYAAIIALFIGLGFKLNAVKGKVIMAENSTQYRYVVSAYSEAIDYMRRNHKEAFINAQWPMFMYMEDPYFGYVKNIFPNLSKEFKSYLSPHRKRQVDYDCGEHPYDFVMVASDGNIIERERQLKFIQLCGYVRYKTLGNSRSKVKIYSKK